MTLPGWGEKVLLLAIIPVPHIRRDTDLETLYRMGLFHAFEQQPIDPCVPFFNEKAAAVAMIRHGMHGHTA